jgi:hypothetical protein
MKVIITESQLDLILENKNIPMKEIMRGYIDAALWTEEERLRDEVESIYDYYDEDDYSEDTDSESKKELNKLIKLTAEMNNKPFSHFEKDDIDEDSIINVYTDIKKFISLVPEDALNEALNKMGPESFGHDIWLTRNHHGSGFWDNGFSKDTEESLMDAIKVLRGVNLVIGDDMKLYFE